MCPSCGGAQLPNHPAGVLAIQHRTNCPLLAKEDARKVADRERLARAYGFDRDPTETEQTLLAALGHLTPATATRVTVIAPGVMRHTWTFGSLTVEHANGWLL